MNDFAGDGGRACWSRASGSRTLDDAGESTAPPPAVRTRFFGFSMSPVGVFSLSKPTMSSLVWSRELDAHGRDAFVNCPSYLRRLCPLDCAAAG